MEYDFGFENKNHHVEIKSQGTDGVYGAIIDGRNVEFILRQFDDNTYSLINGNNYTTIHIGRADSKFFIHIDGKVFEVVRIDKKNQTYSTEGLEYGSKDEITSPMPGKIVKIMVKVGDSVKAKQPLVIIESMKMENEIKALVDGVVKSIHFKTGDLVPSGQLIIKLDPNL